VTLTPYQVQLPTGTIAGAGTSIGLKSISGLRDLPAIRAQDQERWQGDGAYPSPAYTGERVLQIVWELTLATNLESSLSSLAAGFQNVTDPSAVCMTSADYLTQLASAGTKPVSALTIQLPNRPNPFMVFGRPTKYNAPIDANYQYGQVNVTSEWTASDGLLYDAGVNTATVTVAYSTGGAPFPWTFPVHFGTSTGGIFTAANAGSYPASPVYKITGPVTNPKILNTATGQYITVKLTLATGDVLIIDTQSRAIRLNGVNRNNVLDTTSAFFKIPAGGTSLQFASSDSGTVAGQLTAYTLNTYSAI
jgi:hypothetical protein